MGIRSAKPTIDVCLVASRSMNLRSLGIEAASKIADRYPGIKARLWAWEGARDFRELIRGSDMRVSTIPDIVDVPDSFLFGTEGLAMPLFYEAGMAPRKLSDFDHFVAASLPEYPSKHDVIASMSRWAGVRDDAIILGWGTRDNIEEPSGTVCGRRMGSYRANNTDVVRVLKYHMTRNTAPLILAEIARLITEDGSNKALGKVKATLLNASNVQHFYKCLENGYVSDESPLSMFVPGNYIWGKRHEPDGTYVTTSFDAVSVATRLVEKMHPSGRDPKFDQRVRGWIDDWPSSKSAAEKWIKTWSGRLRRKQATRYKAATERSDFVSAAVSALAQESDDANNEIGSLTRIASALSCQFQEPEREIYKEVLASVHSTMTGFPRAETPLWVRERFKRSAVVSATRLQIEMWNLGAPVADAELVLNDLPPAWADGAAFAKKMFDAGRDSVVSMLSGGRPDPDRAVSETEIFTGTSSFPHENHGEPAAKLKVNVEGMTAQRASAEIAFARGKCAAWIALTGNGGLLAGKEVGRNAICAMAVRAAEISLCEGVARRPETSAT